MSILNILFQSINHKLIDLKKKDVSKINSHSTSLNKSQKVGNKQQPENQLYQKH